MQRERKGISQEEELDDEEKKNIWKWFIGSLLSDFVQINKFL